MKKTLWTKNFTIITIGTLISMCGVAVLQFSGGLVVLDKTNSIFFFAIFLVLVNIPAILMPLLIGPYLDRFSRKKIIVILDYSASLVVGIAAVLLYFNLIPTWGLFVFGAIIGGIAGSYNVTYESFYPTLIPKGFTSQAYSVSSLIFPIANTIFLPIAAYVYEKIGLPILFLFTSLTYFTAATFENFINVHETHLDNVNNVESKYNPHKFIDDFKAGLNYLKKEKGLQIITILFFFIFLSDSCATTLQLPFFKNTEGFTVMQYSYVCGINTFGRIIGGLFLYRYHIKSDKRFKIAFFVYIFVSVVFGLFYFTPVYVMYGLALFMGASSVISYTIRTSSTQTYVDDSVRGRFNGVFLMFTFLGQIIGQLIAGLLGEIYPIRYIVLGSMMLYLFVVLFILLPNRKHVEKIYNAHI